MKLTIQSLCKEAALFTACVSQYHEPALFGITDGKKIGTYLEHRFRRYLQERHYQFQEGNSAIGIDFPDLAVDMKVTSEAQPQSSCPFKSAHQKIYGLGYSLLIFVYRKTDDEASRTANLCIVNTVFVDSPSTADFQITKGILDILYNKGNSDDIRAFLSEKNLPVDDIGLENLVEEVMKNKPTQGYLTISNALQWRLQYSHVIKKAGEVDGVQAIYQRA